jgi:hypothetical protein
VITDWTPDREVLLGAVTVFCATAVAAVVVNAVTIAAHTIEMRFMTNLRARFRLTAITLGRRAAAYRGTAAAADSLLPLLKALIRCDTALDRNRLVFCFCR